jgi:hypothetical protein
MRIRPVFHSAILHCSSIHLHSTAHQHVPILTTLIIQRERVYQFVQPHLLCLVRMQPILVCISVLILVSSNICLVEYVSIPVLLTTSCKILLGIVLLTVLMAPMLTPIQAIVWRIAQLGIPTTEIILVWVPVLHLTSKIQLLLSVYLTVLTSLLLISKSYKEQIDTVILFVQMVNLEILLFMYVLRIVPYLL